VSDPHMLEGKRAVIFGAGGSIGAAVASECAAEGAEVFLAGRTRSNVDAVAQRIGKAGHRAHAAVIDALDDAAVNTYVDRLVGDAGQIDAKDVGRVAADLVQEEWTCRRVMRLRASFA
jgi:3-oxoacyl-[acyl-carrier protein] reductase